MYNSVKLSIMTSVFPNFEYDTGRQVFISSLHPPMLIYPPEHCKGGSFGGKATIN